MNRTAPAYITKLFVGVFMSVKTPMLQSETTLYYWMMVESIQISRKRLVVQSMVVKSPLYLTGNLPSDQ